MVKRGVKLFAYSVTLLWLLTLSLRSVGSDNFIAFLCLSAGLMVLAGMVEDVLGRED